MALMVAAGCTKIQTSPMGQSDQEIVFDAPVISRATRAATEVADDFPTDQSFNVYAYYYENMFTSLSNGQLYMDNVEVAYSEILNGWDSKTVEGGINYYWPTHGTLTFAAYAPTTGAGTVSYGESGFTFKDFKVADEPEDQIDLLFSERAYNKTVADQLSDNPFYSGVQLNFMHALSSIMFKVKVDDMLVEGGNNYEFLVKKIEVLGALNQGTFKQNIPSGGDNPTTPMASEIDWTNYSSTTKDYIAYEGALTVNSKTAVSTIGDNANKTNLILLPQQLYRNQTSKVQVRVSYDYRHSGMEAGSYITGSVSTVDIATNDVATWLRGKRYVYTLTLGLYEITFTPRVEAWTATPEVNLPTIQ